MKFSNRFKLIWWIGLIIVGGLLLYLQWHDFTKSHPTTFDTVLLAIVAALLLMPLFSEISFLGISVKQNIEKIKDELAGIKSEISNKIDFSPEIHFGTDDRAIRERITEVMNEMGIRPTSHERDVFNTQIAQAVPQDNFDMFAARFAIERELRRIYFARNISPEYVGQSGFFNTSRMINDLLAKRVIPQRLGPVLKDILPTLNKGIHGQDITQTEVQFVRDVVQDIVTVLQEIES